MDYALGFLISAFVVAIVAAPLFREHRAWAALAPHTRRAVLLEQRDTLLRELKDLEFDRRMGKIDDADYAEMHTSLARRTTTVLDALEALKPTGRGRNGSASASWHRALDVEAEVLVARARLRLRGGKVETRHSASEELPDGAWHCECGRTMKRSDKFCASCGASRPQV
ncbi:MAG TPA: hypothetical protein VGB77_09805 [Abditibacteriaceae bacterium]|jgi:hypothetical protein